jgi:hypothetical protein
MTALTIELDLSDQLAEDARNAGLLSSEAIEALLRERLKKRGVGELLEMADRLAAVDLPPMSEEEIQAEVDAVRAERRAHRS